MIMDDYYSALKSKLDFVSKKEKNEFDDKMKKMLSFLVGDIESDYSNIIADKIISQYEETKNDITFGVVIENDNKQYLTYILIFEKEKTYSNILLRKFDKHKIIEAKNYFTELKDMIVNNDISKLSKLIIDKL